MSKQALIKVGSIYFMIPPQPQPPSSNLTTQQKDQLRGVGCLVLIVVVIIGAVAAWTYSSADPYQSVQVSGNSDGNGGTTFTHYGEGYTARFTPSTLYTIAWNCSGTENMLVSVINVATGNYDDQWNATCNFNGLRDEIPSQPDTEYYIEVTGIATWTITINLSPTGQRAQPTANSVNPDAAQLLGLVSCIGRRELPTICMALLLLH